ncbi:MAG TPA: DUF4149 domain-containing protein [Thermodesulfobacteriota bacterium]|jgi:uncharacterized membrane protein
MDLFYILVVLIHLLAAILWLGGMFFIAIVIVPVLRRLEPPQIRIEVLSTTARRFRIVSWIALLVLVVTGALNSINRGITLNIISTGVIFSTHFGKVLTLKVVVVLFMLVLSSIHDFLLGPRLTELISSSKSNSDFSPAIKKYRRLVSLLARINALLGIMIVACAVMLS